MEDVFLFDVSESMVYYIPVKWFDLIDYLKEIFHMEVSKPKWINPY